MLKLSSSSLHFVQIPKIPHIVSDFIKDNYLFFKLFNFDPLTPYPPLPGLEYSAGEGTNYPPKFDSAPGKPAFTLLLFLCILYSA